MWIATTSGFFSVVIDNQRPGRNARQSALPAGHRESV
jgi:hypothetical protein